MTCMGVWPWRRKPVFRSGLINHFFRIGFGHRIGDVSVFRILASTNYPFLKISAPVFFVKTYPSGLGWPTAAKELVNTKRRIVLALIRLKDMVIFGKASSYFWESLDCINGGASMNDRVDLSKASS